MNKRTLTYNDYRKKLINKLLPQKRNNKSLVENYLNMEVY